VRGSCGAPLPSRVYTWVLGGELVFLLILSLSSSQLASQPASQPHSTQPHRALGRGGGCSLFLFCLRLLRCSGFLSYSPLSDEGLGLVAEPLAQDALADEDGRQAEVGGPREGSGCARGEDAREARPQRRPPPGPEHA
jgi:hypothetical protein